MAHLLLAQGGVDRHELGKAAGEEAGEEEAGGKAGEEAGK